MDYIFLICSERSGSNLITKILDAHPAVCGPSPTHLFRTFYPNLSNYGALDLDANWCMLVEDVVAILAARLGVWATECDAADLINMPPRRNLASLLRFIYEREAAAHGKNQLFVKENRAHRLVPYILRDFPQARFLYMVRDPRDMALSFRTSANHPGGLETACELWREDQAGCLPLLEPGSDGPPIHLLKYEDLLVDPENSLLGVVDFLGLPFDERMLAFHRIGLTVANAQRIKNWENLQKPILANNQGKYRRHLKPDEIRYIEWTCRAEMEALGYAFDFPPPTQIDPPQEPEQAQPNVKTDEEEIRQRRLTVIRRILARNPAVHPAGGVKEPGHAG